MNFWLFLWFCGIISIGGHASHHHHHHHRNPPSVIIVEDANVCFRRILRGCRLDESLVRHSLPAVDVEACRKACLQEDHFTCEGFNYRPGVGACELTAVPLSLLNLNRDARPDREYDVYVRDRNSQQPYCPPDDIPFQWNPSDSNPRPGLYPDNNIGDSYAPGHHGWSPPDAAPPRPPGGAEVGFYGHNHQTSSTQNDQFPTNYGYNYGYDYNQQHNSLIPPPAPPLRDPPPPPPPVQSFVPRPDANGECFVHAHGGHRLADSVVQSVVPVPDLPGCEHACSTARFRCNSFSFRYNVWPYNCDLSVHYTKSNADLFPDRNADVFVRERSCAPRPPGWDSKSECFVMSPPHSNSRLDASAIRDTILAESLGGCEAACLAAVGYVCRAFSYRYGSPPPDAPVPGANCLLSDWPAKEIIPWRHTKPEVGTELYGRDSYGRGCELDWKRMDGPRDGPPYLPHPSAPPKPTIFDQLCYVGWGRPARLVPSAVFTAMRVPTELDCKAICTRARGTANCASISYKSTNVASGEPNCALSAKPLHDLRPGFDVDPDPDYWLFSWNNQDPHCAVLPHEPPPQPSPPYGIDPHGPHGPHDHHHGGHDHQGGYGYQGPYDHVGPYFPPGGEDAIWRDESAGVWKRFSVTGQPCRSVCAPHPIGIWSCELQNGGWDYCCRPGHNCGFSEGYTYPWCYVGNAAHDQWRPCSEHYQPDHQSGGQYGNGHHQHEEARYWPVSYLHPAPPYNISGSRDHRLSFAPLHRPWIPVRTSKLLPFNVSCITTSTTSTTPRPSSSSTTLAPSHKDSDDIFGSEAVATNSNATSVDAGRLELEIIDTLDGAGTVAENSTSANRTHTRRKFIYPDEEDEEEYEDENSDTDDNSAKRSQRKHKILKISDKLT